MSKLFSCHKGKSRISLVFQVDVDRILLDKHEKIVSVHVQTEACTLE